VCRFFLFRPDAKTRQNFLYCLGVAAERHGIVLHSAVLMSTHLHVVFTDPRGVYPNFLWEFHRLLANCTKVARGWGHEVFDGSGSHILHLVTEGAVIEKCGYTIANPVDCGAVPYAREWPGFVTRPRDIGGKPIVVERPEGYFDENGSLPERVVVRFVLPARLVDKYGDAGARQLIADKTDELEREARRKVREKGHTFLGAAKVLKASPYRRAKAYEVFGAMRPNFSTKGGTKQDYIDEVQRRLAFHTAYRESWELWCAGDHDVVFPYGTWLMRVRFGARVAPPPD
jgi:hypothetical protein